MTRQARLRGPRLPSTLKAGADPCAHDLGCDPSAVPVFRAVRLDLAEDEELVDIEVRILENNQPIERLDGHEILSDVTLAVEAVAMIRGIGGFRDESITDPIAVSVSEGGGGAVSNRWRHFRPHLEVPPVSSPTALAQHFSHHDVYDEPDGSPCCWSPPKRSSLRWCDVEIDDGDGERCTRR